MKNPCTVSVLYIGLAHPMRGVGGAAGPMMHPQILQQGPRPAPGMGRGQPMPPQMMGMPPPGMMGMPPPGMPRMPPQQPPQ